MFILSDVPLFPEQASTTAVQVDALYFFLLAVSGLFAVLIAGLVIYFAVKYRRRFESDRPARILGSLRLEIFWSVVPLAISMVMFFWGASVYFSMARPPDDAMEIYVVGKQWMWKIQHPDGQREINELHVPVDRPVMLTMTSEDVIHDFFVPAFRVKQDVLPGRYVRQWFQATRPGKYHLFCSQYCGTNHSRMIGTVTVLERSQYEDWLRNHAEGSLALEGRKLFLKLQCVSCHSADARARAPNLEGLYNNSVRLTDGRALVADADYLRESILKPRAKIVAGYEPIMPTFEGQVTEEDILKVIAFIRALGPGQTPPRVESAPTPDAPIVPVETKTEIKKP